MNGTSRQHGLGRAAQPDRAGGGRGGGHRDRRRGRRVGVGRRRDRGGAADRRGGAGRGRVLARHGLGVRGAGLIGAGHAVLAQLPAEDTPLALTAQDRKDCPAAATACVDLTRHLTWLQSGGKVSFGPVRMEPGKPGSGPHATPAGTFQVQWKAGPDFVSDIYNEPMPWATFFAPGGVAFHGGSLTSWSHGCVHLTVANAHYYKRAPPHRRRSSRLLAITLGSPGAVTGTPMRIGMRRWAAHSASWSAKCGLAGSPDAPPGIT